MYYSHFGLSQPPFKITPNTEFFFSGGNRGPVLDALIYAITQGEGIVKVTGEVGSGKTMLCHMLQTRLPEHIETVYIANPSVSPEEILHAIAFELQLGVAREASRLEVMQALHDYLLERHSEGKRVVVFVEESQSMPVPSLEEIRLLSNLETKNDKLLQIVLFGQPELDENLRQKHIRQLRERITHSFRLEPLSMPETREYLMFRMRAAGYHGPELFSDPVVKAICRAAQGLTRRVNLIADKALLAAFSENTHTVKRKHVEAAVRDSEFSAVPDPSRKFRPFWGMALLAAGAAVGVGVYAVLQGVATGDLPTRIREQIARLQQKVESHAPAAAPTAQSTPANPTSPVELSRAEGPRPLPETLPQPTPPAKVSRPEKTRTTPDTPAKPTPPAAAGRAEAAHQTVAAPSPPPSPAPAKSAASEPTLPSVPAESSRASDKPPSAGQPEARAMASPATPKTEPTVVAAAQQKAPADSTDPAASSKAIDSRDILEARIAATESWLEAEAPETLSIQLLGTNNAEFLKLHLNELAKLIEIKKVFVYRTRARKQPSLTVLYGSFNSYRVAQEALDKLPESLKVNRPFLRTIAGVRGEIARNAGS